jgi:valyl-tRNA synthetase
MNSNQLSAPSIWVLKKFIQLKLNLKNSVAEFDIAHAIDDLYKFLWNDYADWYVEYLKTNATDLLFAKELYRNYIILLSPYSPFETQALWQDFFGETSPISLEVVNENWALDLLNLQENQLISNEFESIVQFIQSIRSQKGLFGLDPATQMEVYSTSGILSKYQELILKMSKTKIIVEEKMALYNVKLEGFEYSLDINDLVKDKPAELSRTQKIIENLEKQVLQIQNQLSNQGFLNSAEAEVIVEKKEQLQARQIEIKLQQDKLEFLK